MKKLLLGLSVIACASLAHASYLYWQVGEETSYLTQVTGDEGTYYTFNGHQVTEARIYQTTSAGSTLLTPQYVTDSGDLATAKTGSAGGIAVPMQGSYVVDLGDLASSGGYSYYIELIGYDNAVYGNGTGVIGQGETVSYATLAAQGSITTSVLSMPKVWTGGGSASVPEPTSGMLLLMGLTLLSLKRRKA